MKTLILPFFVFAFIFSFSQSADVDVISEKTDTGFTVKAINNTDVQREFTVTLEVHNLKGYTKPIKKLVPAKSTVKIIDLTKTPNEYNNLKYKYSHKVVPSKEEAKKYNAQKKAKVLSGLDIKDERIVVFAKDGCGRCNYTTSFLMDNDIDFKMINVTQNPEANRLMWDLLRIEQSTAKSIKMPVILVDGKLSHSHQDIKDFVSTLNK